MPKQEGLNPYSHGSIDNITFVKHPVHGLLARRRYGPPKEKIDNDPAYAVQKKSYKRLGTTSHTCKIIRDGLEAPIAYGADSFMNTRLVKIGTRVFDAGREISEHHPFNTTALELLKGFNFNENTGIKKLLDGALEVTREKEKLRLVVPRVDTSITTGATHYRVAACLCSFDFEHDLSCPQDKGSEIVETNILTGNQLEFGIPEQYPVHLLVFGVIFYQYVNGGLYTLRNSETRALDIVDVIITG